MRPNLVNRPTFRNESTVLFFLMQIFLIFPCLTSCQGSQNLVQATKTQGLVANEIKPEDLQYEIIAQGSFGSYGIGSPEQPGYSLQIPRLLVISSADQIKNTPPNIYIGSVVSQNLEAVDYKTNFVIVVLRGKMASSSPLFVPEILKVTRESTFITVYTLFRSEIGQLADMAVSSPYTIIKIPKTGKWGRLYSFYLDVSGGIPQQNQEIP